MLIHARQQAVLTERRSVAGSAEPQNAATASQIRTTFTVELSPGRLYTD
jgi:hypothetical protein